MAKQSGGPEGKGKYALLFPGADAYVVGMGRDLYQNFASARAVYKEADDTLGFALSRTCFEGPEEELARQSNVQPAIVVTSLAILRAAEEAGLWDKAGPPAFIAGNSLGEMGTPAAAGMLGLADAVRLVRERGRLMEEANVSERVSKTNPGAHVSIIRLDLSLVEEVCRETGAFLSAVVCPGNIVVSAPQDLMARVRDVALAKGAYRVISLPGVASHCPIMQPAADGLAKYLERISFRDATIPVLANTTARPITRGKEMKAELVQQLLTPVLWQGTLEYMMNSGVTAFVPLAAARGQGYADHVKWTNVDKKPLKIPIMSNLDTIKAALEELGSEV